MSSPKRKKSQLIKGTSANETFKFALAKIRVKPKKKPKHIHQARSG